MRVREVLCGVKEKIPPLDAEVLLSYAIGRPREFFISRPESEVDSFVLDKFNKLCEKRTSGVPLAYLINYKEFFGLGFYVDENVLIPRPETEILVEECLRVCAKAGAMNICDVGTGCGCIAIALAKNCEASITAIDISEKALEVAGRNCGLHAVSDSVTLINSDLLQNVLKEKFDIIVANLPYIGINENHLVAKDVLDFEPHIALFGGEDGLSLFNKLFEQIKSMDCKPNYLIAEIGFSQHEKLERLIKNYFGKKSVSWKNDLAGLTRAFTLHF